MIKKKCGNIFLVIAMLVTTCVYAQPIPCPEIKRIQVSAPKINTVVKLNGLYSVYTSTYPIFENNIAWRVGTSRLIATSNEDAIQKGRALVLNIAYKKQKEADFTKPYYSCAYGPGDVYAVGLEV